MDDEIILQNAKVKHAIFGGDDANAIQTTTGSFARTLQEAAVTGKQYVPPSGLTDDDVRRREHPEEFAGE